MRGSCDRPNDSSRSPDASVFPPIDHLRSIGIMTMQWSPVLMSRDGVRLAHFEAGPATPQSPPLLLINGWTGDHGIFTPQIAHFSKSRRVVAINLRGHGASDAP